MKTKGNIKHWLVAAEKQYGEKIDTIVIGRHYNKPDSTRKPELLTRRNGLFILDETFDDGFGGADCYPILAWSKSRVFFIAEYDGATHLTSVPRNPTVEPPGFI